MSAYSAGERGRGNDHARSRKERNAQRPVAWIVTIAIAQPLGFGIAASAATMLGGLLALRVANRLPLILAVTAGVVLGVAFFDLLPEALAAGAATYGDRAILGFAALGLGAYMVLDRGLAGASNGSLRWRAHLGPASLTLHSFLDGLGTGLAFQVSPEIGWLVGFAVLTHDVADGINTVNLALAASRQENARRWLVANGLAPLLGVVTGLVVQVPASLLAPMLGVFAGVLLYIAACELVPRSYANDPRIRTTLASIGGMLLMLLVTHWAK